MSVLSAQTTSTTMSVGKYCLKSGETIFRNLNSLTRRRRDLRLQMVGLNPRLIRKSRYVMIK